jgi:hypothetical protein
MPVGRSPLGSPRREAPLHVAGRFDRQDSWAQPMKCVAVHTARRDLRLEQRRHIETIQHMLAFFCVQPLLERLYTI